MKFPQTATWSNSDHDVEVVIVGEYGEFKGRKYYRAASNVGIPADELKFKTKTERLKRWIKRKI